MKIFLILFFTLIACSSFASNQEARTTKQIKTIPANTKNSLKIKSLFYLSLFQDIIDCPSGYAGTTTFWIVYDGSTGVIYGYGTTGGCIPVSYA